MINAKNFYSVKPWVDRVIPIEWDDLRTPREIYEGGR